MIVIESRALVILTPPHTASGNLQRALCSSEIGGQVVLGENPARTVDHHNVLVPPAWKDFRRVLVVRHPLSRLIGLWMHYSHAAKQPSFDGRADLTWPAFVLAVAEDHPGYLTWFFRWTITRLIELVDRLDLLLHFESLESEVSELLGVNIVLPPAYHGATCVDQWFADARLRGMAEAWGQTDRLRFNYG